MKIDRNKLKKSTTEVPADCRVLIDKLRNATEDDLYKELQTITTVTSWTYGKCELYHWSDILDKFDEILEKACKKEVDKWTLACDVPTNDRLKELLLYMLDFTSLLIEHSFSRHLYNSMEHLTTLLSSCDMTIVLGVLNLLYVFSKRSNFITRLSNDKKQGLLIRLTHLAESWGGKDNGFGLAECCKDVPISSFPLSATTLHFEFYVENKDEKGSKKNTANTITSIHMENLDKSSKLPSQIMEDLLTNFKIPEEKQMLLYTHIRLAHLFSNYQARVQCVQARLQALAILVYSNAIQENMNSLLYAGLIEELVDIVELKDNTFVEIKAASLRTLTSIIHLERNPKLNNIIDATGASSYHGFLPVLVRSCIQHMTDAHLTPFPQKYATALFSFLYHLASYENGVEALVSCGMMECLLKVINWYGDGQEHITQFVTRAVRVVDLITNLDMAAFQAQGGLFTFINRLEHEVDLCRKEQPFEIKVKRRESVLEDCPVSPSSDMETESAEGASARSADPVDSNQPSTSAGVTNDKLIPQNPTKTGVQCYPQRAALLKSMLNFLKKAIPDPSFSDSIRHLMEGSLPKSLRHIISNAEYYGPSLFLLATDVVTVYVFQEPSLLSSLQDNGLTDVVLHALLIKDVPATREVLASLPNVFSALCLNARGLQSFVSCKPFDRLFKVLLSPDYLPAMRRRRGSDPFGDTASNLGNAMDELMRHQPSLRTDATKAIIKLLEEVCTMGRDQKYVCVKPAPKTEPQNMSVQSPQPPDNNSSDEEDDDDEIPNTQDIDGNKPEAQRETGRATAAQSTPEKQQIPLMDYVLNVMKFVEAILTNNSTDDHCREFVSQNGLEPLMSVLGLPNLPIDFPTSPACQTVSIVCKSILNLSREPQVLKQGLVKLDEVLQRLSPLHEPLDLPGGSVLLRELSSVISPSDATLSPQATPLLHALSSCHAYIMMFVHVCRMGQTDLRTISVNHWGSELGLKVLGGLSKLYTSLVWESTVLLALCSEDVLPPGCLFGKEDMDKLLPKDFKAEKEDLSPGSTKEMGSNGVSAAMESLSTSENNETPMEVNEGASTSKEDKDKRGKMSPALQAQVKQLKPLLSVSSRLCRTLAELFSLLVKLCVGSPVRQRRSQQIPLPPTVPSPSAQAVAKSLTKLLTNGFKWEPPPYSPVPKLKLTFLVCFVGFMSMLFDEKKQPFHLMLQKFVALGGQDALFKAFEWALTVKKGKLDKNDGLEQPELSEQIAEFLDSWLMLIERMSNPKTILETPHVMPAKSSQSGYVPFSAVQYLIKAQKAAFKAVMSLWNKKPLRVYGGRMSESMLAILCNIIKGENIIKERLAKEREEMGDVSNPLAVTGPSTSGGAGASPAVPMVPSRPSEPDVDEAHLQQLMDMGFTREHCVEALTLTTSLEQATEFILTHPPSGAVAGTGIPVVQGPPAPVAQNPLGMVMEMSEEDQMMQAIALSLGENVVMSAEESNAPSGSGTKTTENKPPKAEEEKVEEFNEKQEDQEPLEKSILDNFTAQVLPGCLRLLDVLPETVYRVCDLLIVVTNRNGTDWQKMVLANLVKEIQSMGQQILKIGHDLDSTDTNKDQLNSDASKFAARLHLFSLLFEEMMLPCAESVESVWLTDLLVQVLNSGQKFLTANKDSVTPKWLSPLLLLLDLYEKVAVISKRKAQANELLCHSHTWKWFDDSSGRWCKYSAVNNKTIDDAYQAGETSIRFQAGRRRYTVHFNSMVQINEETGNRRPIMLAFPSPEELSDNGNKEESKEVPAETAQSVSKMETEIPVKSEGKMKESVIVSGMNSKQIVKIIRCIVSMMNIPVEAECLHAALRLILRLTRNHKNAVLFAELGGPRILLTLTQSSSFPGFISLASLIFRHIIEEPDSLRYSMEKVVKKALSGTGSSSNGVKPGSMGSKEVNYVFRALGPAACRDEEAFALTIKGTCHFALPPASSRRDDDARHNSPQILKSVFSTKSVPMTVYSPIKEVLHDLLNCLIAEFNYQDDGVSGGFEVQPPCTLAEAIASEMRPPAIPRQGSSADIANEEEQTGESENSKDQVKDKDAKVTEDQQNKRPLMPKSSVLRLLSEVVKSYSTCTQLITQYTYHTGQTPLVHEECTVLAFVLDNLLPQCQIFGDRDCPALSRVFVASIASCNHSPDAQMSLVTEIKGALQRALALPESALKHTRIRALTNLISIIIDSCPSPGGQVPNQMFKGQQTVMNNIVKSLLKKGLVTDLARLPHSLDLSSPYMANTINSALKPLETLSRSVNQPAQSVVSKVKKSETETSLQQTTESQENNTTVPAPTTTPAEPSHVGEITIEDISDHADTGTMEETQPISAVEPENDEDGERGESELDNVLDVLLNRDGNLNPSNEVIGDIVMDSEDLTLHDSQMVSQEISIDDDDGEHVHGDDSCIPNEDDSASDVDDEDDDDEDDGDDGDGDDGEDEDDEDDEEEDDDDEGSDMEAEDEDDYPDIDPSLNPMSEFDYNYPSHMDELFPSGGGRGQSLLFNDSSGLRNFGFQIPISLHDNDNGNDDSSPAIPPAPVSVMSSHPLLVRQPEGHTVMGVQRLHRGRGRREASCRYNPTTQTLHVNLQRQPNPPVILQRLLGPTTAADVLQLTSTLTSVAGPTPGRLLVGNDDLRIISRPDDDFLEEILHDSYGDGGQGGSGVLTCIPSTLTRWTEEAKVLDGDSIHDCVTVLKESLISYLEKKRDDELAERKEELAEKKEKSHKLSEEPETNMEKTSNSSIGWESPQNMEVTQTPATTSASNVPIAVTNVTMATTSDSTVTSTAGRQISASEAAAAAELIATAVVEDILSNPQGRPVAPPQPSITRTDPLSLVGPPADTYTTPAITMPSVVSNAPVMDQRSLLSFSGGASAPSGSCNLASLLMTEDSSPDSPLSSSSIDAIPQVIGHGSMAPNVAPPIQESRITPEEVSGISDPSAVNVQSTESSGEAIRGNIVDTTTTNSASGAQPSTVLDNIASALTIDTSGISTPPAFHGFSAGLYPENTQSNEPPVNLSALTTSMMGALSASINVPSSILSSGGEAGSSLVSEEGPTPSATNPLSASALVSDMGFGEFPDGVDPSFLEALPENIRQEVIAEQMRLQRIRQSAREQAQTAQSTGSLQVNPEFLAALPPNIQEEVLAQQRTEQARMTAMQQQSTTNSEAPVDPVSFLASLPSSLRQQVLADMDDSTVAVLPPDLAAEAQTLRRELEERHRRLMQERLFAQAAGAGFGGRLGGGRFAIRALPRSSNQWTWASSRLNGPSSSSNQNAVKLRGRHLLDHEALTCLLVLLFVDEPKLNTIRLHRVLRNLCYHGPTRVWVIRALLSILQKTGECRMEDEKALRSGEKGKKKLASDSDMTVKSDTKNQGSWLSISLEAALGCRANVFQIHKMGKKHLSGGCPGTVTIHDQASPVVCRHVLDTLIALAKVFPSQFLPTSKVKEVEKCNEPGEESKTESDSKPKTSCSSSSASPKSAKDSPTETDFWDLLIKLDSLNANKKGKSVQKTASNAESEANFFNYDSSPLGQLMFMLSHPVVKRSQLLTDRLLRLLGLVSLALPDATRGNATSSTTAAPAGVTNTGLVTTTAPASTSTTQSTPAVVSRGVSTSPPKEEKREESTIKEIPEDKQDDTVVLEDRLQLAVQVLTSKSCSEEGLEDATNLLLQLSWANNATRQAVLKLLLEGARVLGLTVCSHIRSLLEELSDFAAKNKDPEEDKDMETAPSQSSRGLIQDRYNPSTSVVVAAPKKIKVGRELQLPSMSLLTSKTSSQQFFLRILKVIIQLRDAAKTQAKRTARRGERDLSSITEAMAALEAEAEAIMEMVGRRSEQQNQARQQQEATNRSGTSEQAAEGAQEGQQGGADNPPPVDANPESPMDVDQPGPSTTPQEKTEESAPPQLSLSEQLSLEELWNTLGECLTELAKTPDHHAVLILQPAVEAFFIVHAGEKDGKSQEQRTQRREDQLAHLNIDLAPASPAAPGSETPAPVQRDGSVTSVSSLITLPPDTQKFLKFAETHRTVLNQILRQSTTPLSDGPFSVLVDHTRILDFDVKRRYFRQELERLDEGMRREDLAVHVRREHVFEDSFRELFRRTADEWKHRFYIVFEGEEGQDAGGLLREWYIIISREIFNPMYALFRISPGDRVTYTINPSSHCNSNHLSYYKFVGRIIAKAVYDNKLLECYFTRSFYKHIIGQLVKYTDMESEDYSFYQGLVFLIENNVADLGYDLTFSTEIEEFGVTECRDLKPGGRNISVNEDNKKEYVKLVCQMKMTGAIRQQLNAFMEGFYDIIPKRLISIFNEQELELLISGLPTIDIDDLKANTEYHKYQATSLQVQWFWRALRSFDQKDRAQFLQFVTGTSKVPLQGFAFLEGMNGYQKFQIHRDDRSTDRLPVAHTCFNQLDLPAYETYDKLKRMLLLAINECSEGFGLA
ncbi:E3 ubiquitin-protein ligase HUWE1-like isoform X5 [Ostrea edulis]|uniref:E3 ubiquitin-protein ligase HUWE1-like isoform X5 n=1 Tax=Ostrea edulis TaxID=37623 RepID=UPI0024AF0EF5|nr:E3 ubiquitin-protein ligase HUWE1-like isoform X5 [Ostrea edulis]